MSKFSDEVAARNNIDRRDASKPAPREEANRLNFIDARIREIEEGVVLLHRNVDRQEWKALDSNLHYVAAKAQTALAKLHEMQQAWIDEMDAV